MPSEDHTPGQCLEMFKKLSEYIDNELDDPACEALEHHLDECTPCRICLATLRKTVTLCRNMDSAPVPEGLSVRLMQRIQTVQNNSFANSLGRKTPK